VILPQKARSLLVLAHGAGAGMRHPFMEAISRKLAEFGIGTFRYQFLYMEREQKRPDPQPRESTPGTSRCLPGENRWADA